jgi:hypothetical protein
MVSSVPWPYPDNGAENYVNNVALPDMEKGLPGSGASAVAKPG